MNRDPEVGDVVVLKSGSEAMTVEEIIIEAGKTDRASCVWFERDDDEYTYSSDIKRAEFKVQMLQIMDVIEGKAEETQESDGAE